MSSIENRLTFYSIVSDDEDCREGDEEGGEEGEGRRRQKGMKRLIQPVIFPLSTNL